MPSHSETAIARRRGIARTAAHAGFLEGCSGLGATPGRVGWPDLIERTVLSIATVQMKEAAH
jgi:hypothetical protein